MSPAIQDGPNHFSVEILGDDVRVFMNDTFLLQGREPVPFPEAIDSGGVALEPLWEAQGSFDNIVVSEIARSEEGRNQNAVVGGAVHLDASASTDPEGRPLSYRWSLRQRPLGSQSAMVHPSAVKASFVPDQPGQYLVELVVNNGRTNSLPRTLLVTTLNQIPTAAAGPDRSARVGETLILDASASSDRDGDALGFQWTLIAKPADSQAVFSDPASASPSFVVDRPGRYVARLVVNDGVRDSSPDSAVVTAAETPQQARREPDSRPFRRP